MSEAKFDWFVPETCEAEPVHAACYTPGPWVVFRFAGKDTDSGDAETVIQCYFDADSGEGATLATVNRWTYGDDPAKPESDANARLIAAAPELLDACRLAVQFIGQQDIIDKIEAAIDKATKGR